MEFVRGDSANQTCMDCARRTLEGPWMSVNYGIVLCIECAGVHRGFGTHISFVRSILHDDLSAKETSSLERGGNAKFAAFLAARGTSRQQFLETSPAARYHAPAAELYRRRMATPAGEALPDDLRPQVQPVAPAAYKFTRDRDAPACELCGNKWSLLGRRRHHCRKCGKCVCGACSPRKKPMPPHGKLARHCNVCAPPER
ncbi:putative GTPase activating protein for Arf-domain-containing protein [Pelagophyceae sp. CCMP2097]|nr:putative GTPase activating protein for Arf-domain-containing protein [Pelagophyceae sp. CCMP2097]